MALTLNRQIIDDPNGKIKFKYLNPGGRRHYNIGVWLDATDEELQTVERVDYLLDPTFKNPNRSSSNRENKFSITFWTWGMFPIIATIHYVDGSKHIISYYLSYSLPADTGTNYVDVSSAAAKT